MAPESIRELAEIRFLTSPEVGSLLDQIPTLIRRLGTTAIAAEDFDHERVAGSPRWGRTIAYRAATGLDHVVVNAPAQRSYDIAENRLLKFLLEEIARIGLRMRWYRSRRGLQAERVRRRTDSARRWALTRPLSHVGSRPPSAREIRRARSSRRAPRYRAVLDAFAIYQDLIGRADAGSLRASIEEQALAVTEEATVLEILVAFQVIDALRKDWEVEALQLVHAGELRLKARRPGQELVLFYQHVPAQLKAGSPYLRVLTEHGLRAVTRRPDLVLELHDGDRTRWCLFEVKGGEVGVKKLARRAAFDLHAYRRVFEPALDLCAVPGRPSGIGVVWGEDLDPQPQDVALCSFDRVEAALALFLD